MSIGLGWIVTRFSVERTCRSLRGVRARFISRLRPAAVARTRYTDACAPGPTTWLSLIASHCRLRSLRSERHDHAELNHVV